MSADRFPELQFICPKCGQKINVATELAGTRMACPHCHQRVVVPGTIEVKHEYGDDWLDLLDTAHTAHTEGTAESSSPDKQVSPRRSDELVDAIDAPIEIAESIELIDDDDYELLEIVDDPLLEPNSERLSVADFPGPVLAELARKDPFEQDQFAPLVVDGITPTGNTIVRTCRLCGTRIDAKPSEIGSKKRCPDCHSMVEILADEKSLLQGKSQLASTEPAAKFGRHAETFETAAKADANDLDDSELKLRPEEEFRLADQPDFSADSGRQAGRAASTSASGVAGVHQDAASNEIMGESNDDDDSFYRLAPIEDDHFKSAGVEPKQPTYGNQYRPVLPPTSDDLELIDELEVLNDDDIVTFGFENLPFPGADSPLPGFAPPTIQGPSGATRESEEIAWVDGLNLDVPLPIDEFNEIPIVVTPIDESDDVIEVEPIDDDDESGPTSDKIV
ncbi:MAG TPA: hypothetical protein PKD64_02660 [Pirellulaceae bacterium]|nr:hypothetical protein [Pirellulaceae bacterium]HMO91071.1 hypothetical protein [Pirellulaceae bacterium]HMP68185.1 hypothetical protein [Pirellulaceae bacterium]